MGACEQRSRGAEGQSTGICIGSVETMYEECTETPMTQFERRPSEQSLQELSVATLLYKDCARDSTATLDISMYIIHDLDPSF